MSERDNQIIQKLHQFRVLSRKHLEQMIFTQSKNPLVLANRVLKRLVRDDYIIAIPQPIDRPYRYMPNPTIIPPSSGRIDHFLGIADVYLSLGKPPTFDVEPNLSKTYKPDAYIAMSNGATAVLEYQRSRISNTKMQEKLDQFVDSFKKSEHKVRTMLIYSNKPYEVTLPSGFQLIQKLLP